MRQSVRLVLWFSIATLGLGSEVAATDYSLATGAEVLDQSQEQSQTARNPYSPAALQRLPSEDKWLLWWGDGGDMGWTSGGVLDLIENVELPPVGDKIAGYAPEFFRTTERRLVVAELPGESGSPFIVGVLAISKGDDLHGEQPERHAFMIIYSGEDLDLALTIADDIQNLYAQATPISSPRLDAKVSGSSCIENCASQNRWCEIGAALDYSICASLAESIIEGTRCGLRLELAILRCFVQFNWCVTLCQPI